MGSEQSTVNGNFHQEASRILPLTAYRLPLTAYRLPLTAYRLPLTAYRLLLTGRCLRSSAFIGGGKSKAEEQSRKAKVRLRYRILLPTSDFRLSTSDSESPVTPSGKWARASPRCNPRRPAGCPPGSARIRPRPP
ncbi:MAG: hypothetical protein FJY54_10530 [Betaproteobacteria bacterium]|nr:hypothetical protein [Betaproteobacteria bacterium]